MQKTLRQHLEMVYKSRISASNLCCTVSQERFLARKMRIRTMSIILWCRILCNVSSCFIHWDTLTWCIRAEFYVASVALSRAADKRKSLINIHIDRYTATLWCLHKVSNKFHIFKDLDQRIGHYTIASLAWFHSLLTVLWQIIQWRI